MKKPRTHYTVAEGQMLNGGFSEGMSVEGFVEEIEQFVAATAEMTDETQEME